MPLCGGNIDTTTLGRVLDRGLAADGRLVRFVATVSDRAGGLSALTRAISGAGASVRDIYHERAWLHTSVDRVQARARESARERERTRARALLSLSSPSQTFALSDVAPRSQIKCIVETRGAAHAEELRAALEAADFPLVWGSSSDVVDAVSWVRRRRPPVKKARSLSLVSES